MTHLQGRKLTRHTEIFLPISWPNKHIYISQLFLMVFTKMRKKFKTNYFGNFLITL